MPNAPDTVLCSKFCRHNPADPTAFIGPKSRGAPRKLVILGSFSNDDGDGNKNFKKAIGLLSKTISLHVHHAFLYISLPLLHDYEVKMPSFTFFGGRKQATTNFSFSF